MGFAYKQDDMQYNFQHLVELWEIEINTFEI